MNIFKFKITILLIVFCTAYYNTAFATDFKMSHNQVLSQHLTDGDTLTVGVDGTLGVNNANAVKIINSNVIHNNGTISATGSGTRGVHAIHLNTSSRNNVINNNGTISATGFNTRANGMVFAASSNNVINNNGTISAASVGAGDANGTYLSLSRNNVINNHGIISAASADAGNAYGINLFRAPYNVINNNGIISATSNLCDVNGVYLGLSSNNVINNNGIISATSTASGNARGIVSESDANTITNSGVIKVSGGPGSAAVDFTYGHSNPNTANNTIHYNTSGYMVGKVIYGNGGGNILNVVDGGQDRNHLLTYEGTAHFTTTANNLIFVKNGNQIATVSRTGFASANQMTKQTTGAISNMIFTRLNKQIYQTRNEHANYYWTEALGSYQQRPRVDTVVRTNSAVGGVIVGVDNRYNDSVFVGAYVGGIKGRITIGNSTNQVINGTGMTIGGYSSIKFSNDRFLDLNLGLGYVYNKSNNLVYNNLATDGIEHNYGSYNEFYFAPSAIFGKYIEYTNFTIVPSVTISYIGQYLSSYKEKGGAAAQTVGSRRTNTIGGIGQITIQKTYGRNTDKPVNVAINCGVEATRMINSGKINVTTIGRSTSFNAVGPKQYIDAILGTSVNRDITKKGMSLFATTQLAKGINYPSSHNYKITLDAGMEMKF